MMAYNNPTKTLITPYLKTLLTSDSKTIGIRMKNRWKSNENHGHSNGSRCESNENRANATTCHRMGAQRYFRMRNNASGPETVYFGGSKLPPPTAKPLGKGGGLRPPPFPGCFVVGRGHLDHRNKQFPARKHTIPKEIKFIGTIYT